MIIGIRNFESGSSWPYMLFGISTLVFVGTVFYDNVIDRHLVTAEELRRLTTIAAKDAEANKEWHAFLQSHPIPTVQDTYAIKRVLDAVESKTVVREILTEQQNKSLGAK